MYRGRLFHVEHSPILDETMRTIDTIVIHCTATREGGDFGVVDVRRWHKAQGWKDVGYHYIVRLDGRIEKGREDAVIGAHAAGHNAHSIGVCYVGGLDATGKAKDTRTPHQREAIEKLVRLLKHKYNARVVSHHDLDKRKACPCFDAKTEYANL